MRRRGFTFAELLISSLILILLVSVAWTWWRTLMLRARRAELGPAVSGIVVAQQVRQSVEGGWVVAPLHPRPVEALDGRQAPWTPHPSWETLGWRPDGPVYGSYQTGEGTLSDLPAPLRCPPGCVVALGLADLDDDGELASVAVCPCAPAIGGLERSVTEAAELF